MPSEWSHGKIHNLYKGKGQKSEPSSYRGITLLPVIGKIFGKILANRLQLWLEKHKRLTMFQAGFRRGYSTIDNLFVLQTLVDKTLNKKKRKLYCAMIDFRSAFDIVNREMLWVKLADIGISHSFIHLIQTIYKDVLFSVKIDEEIFYTPQHSHKLPLPAGCMSVPISSNRGLRQGCQLSSILFALYVNDFCDLLTTVQTHSPNINGIDVQALLYADDLILFSETTIGLQRAINKLTEYSERYHMEINI